MNVYSYETQQLLARYYRKCLADPAELVGSGLSTRQIRHRVEWIEDAWMALEVNAIDHASLPTSPEAFLDWYHHRERALNADIATFIGFLRDEASVEQVAYYICMEELIDGSFDDLMALLQVGMPLRPKMTAARNYWDEMGNGRFEAVHGLMFRTSSRYLRDVLRDRSIPIPTPNAACLMNGNVLLMMATRRDYNLRLIGALGLVEGSAPKRFSATTKAMQRLDLPAEVIAYHKEHISIDTRHSKEWFDSVLTEYAALGLQAIREMAWGVEIRYRVALRYYEAMLHDMRQLEPTLAEA
jgi:Iron-containing redox enzyme